MVWGMDKLSCLRTFVTVVESGGFSESARRLNVSKALISKQISQLEESLGVRLLHRTTRRVSPSSSGQAYYEQCKPLLDDLNELDHSIQTSSKALQGELRLSAPVTFAEMHLLPILAEFSRQYPQVNLQMDLTDRFVNLVEERIDLAIRIGELQESSLVSRRIGSTGMMLCASKEYLSEYSEPSSLDELMGHSCIIDNNYPEGNNWSLTLKGKPVNIRVDAQIQVNNARAARELVRAGRGIGLLPSFVLEDDIAQGNLVHILKNYVSEPVGIYAVYLHRKHLSAKVRRLLDALIAHSKQ